MQTTTHIAHVLRAEVRTVSPAGAATLEAKYEALRIEIQTGDRTVVLKRLTNRAADATYQRVQVGLGRWRGDRVQVRFHSVETQRDQTFWLVDDVAVTPH